MTHFPTCLLMLAIVFTIYGHDGIKGYAASVVGFLTIAPAHRASIPYPV